MRTPILVLALASGLALPAQQASPFRFVPADSALVLRIAAPTTWQQQFASTHFAKLLRGPTLGPMLEQAEGAFEQGLAQMREGGGIDADVVEKLLKEWKGELVVAVHVDTDTLAESMGTGEPPAYGVVVALTGDGSYDFARLATEIEKAAEQQPPPGGFRDLQVGETRLRRASFDGTEMTLPAVVDGHLVMVLGNDVGKFAAQALGDGARFTATTVPGANATRTLHCDLTLGPLVQTLIGALADAPAPVPMDTLILEFGLGALEGVSFSIGADGEHVAGDGIVRLAESRRGIFDVMPAGVRPTKLAKLLPPDADSASVTAADLGALYRLVGRIWQEAEDSAPMTWDDAQTAFAEQMKVRLKEDLVDQLGNELLMLQEVDDAGADPDDPLAALDGLCFALTLRDGKAFGASIETMLRARGLHAARKTEDYQGTSLHRLRLGGLVELEYATTDDLLLIGLGGGEASSRSLRSLLDARANPDAAPELPAPAKERLALLPADWSALSVTRMQASLEGSATMIESAMAQSMGDVPPQLGGVLQMLRQVGGELERFGLQTMVATNRFTAKGLEFNTRW